MNTSEKTDMEHIKVLIVEPGQYPRRAEIANSLPEMKTIVGGYIESVHPWEDAALIICNEEGLVNGLPLNRLVFELGEPIAGAFFICGVDGDNFVSLSEKQLQHYEKSFHYPEIINVTSIGYLVTSCEPQLYAAYMEQLTADPPIEPMAP